jgi:hypothetical protein
MARENRGDDAHLAGTDRRQQPFALDDERLSFFDRAQQLRPAREAVLPGDRVLCVGEAHGGRERRVVEPRQPRNG